MGSRANFLTRLGRGTKRLYWGSRTWRDVRGTWSEATDRNRRRCTSNRRRFVAGMTILCALVSALAGCGPSRDRGGRHPTHVVVAFIEAVQAHDIAAARTFWSESAIALHAHHR